MKNDIECAAVEVVHKPMSDSVYVFFGGIASGVTIPPFEFYSAANILDDNRIFVRDFAQSWYHRPIDNTEGNLEKNIKYLQSHLSAFEGCRKVFVGNSMGGYGAILFSTVLKADRVIVFSPQTFVDIKNRFINLDLRWQLKILSMYKYGGMFCEHYDLLSMMNETSCDIEIYYAIGNRLDAKHAKHLAECGQVSLHGVNSNNHNVVKYLRDSHKLECILK